MSQERLSELLCISPQAISKWENGHTTPEISLLPVLSQIFQCSIDNIIRSRRMIKQRPEPVGLVHRLQKREEKMNIHIYVCSKKLS